MWIDKENFDLISNMPDKHQTTLGIFDSSEVEQISFKVAYDDLLPAQKKLLPTLEGDFEVYTTEKSRPPKTLKDKIVKERLKEKGPDIIKIIQKVLKEKDREKVYKSLVESDISPIVFQIWLLRIFSQKEDTCDLLSKLEMFSYTPQAYFSILSEYTPRGDIKFKFPKKVRE